MREGGSEGRREGGKKVREEREGGWSRENGKKEKTGSKTYCTSTGKENKLHTHMNT